MTQNKPYSVTKNVHRLKWYDKSPFNRPMTLIYSSIISIVATLVFVGSYNHSELIIEFSSKSSGVAQVFYDVGDGFNETDSYRLEIAADEKTKWEIKLPKESVERLRFDPINKEAEFRVHQISLREKFKFFGRLLTAAEITNLNQVSKTAETKSYIQFQSEGQDPNLFLRIEREPTQRKDGILKTVFVCMLIWIGSYFFLISIPLLSAKYLKGFHRSIVQEIEDISALLPKKMVSNESIMLTLISLLALLINLWGIGWGLPNTQTWAPDEIRPNDYVHALNKEYSNGWHSRYPPLHFHIVGSAYQTILELVDPSPKKWGTLPSYSNYYLIARGINLAMSMAFLWVFFLSARLHFSPATSLALSFLCIWIVPLSYYTKIGNLDMPYLFWFSIALFFYLSYLKKPSLIKHILYIATAVCSVASKDQAYALFLLPTLYMLFQSTQNKLGKTKSFWKALISVENVTVCLVFALVFVFTYDLHHNFSGFIGHVKLITGDASAPYRIFDASISGQLKMGGSSLVSILFSIGVLTSTTALVALFLRANNHLKLQLLLPAISYYLFFIAVIGYNYLRFFLPISILLILLSGIAFEKLSKKTNRVVFSGMVLLYALQGIATTVLVNLAMTNDNRESLEMELSLSENPDQVTTLFEPIAYTLRPFMLNPTPEIWDPYRIKRELPKTEFVVLNIREWNRRHPDKPASSFFESIDYHEVKRMRSLDQKLFLDILPVYSNLNKISPEMVLYRKKAPAHKATDIDFFEGKSSK